MEINASTLDAKSAYKLLIGSIIPRPIAWVSTQSVAGVGNLAPISFFTVVGRKPPKVSLSMQPKSDGRTLKDSFLNIRDTGEFVTNLATLPQIMPLHRSAVEFEPDVDEFDTVGVEKEASVLVAPPRVKGSPIALECRVDEIFSSPDGLNHVVWGEVVNFHVRDDIYINGRIDFGALAPVGRLAAEYTVVDNAFVPPLSDEVLTERASRRMVRIDGNDAEYSAVESTSWSASGSVKDEPPTAHD
ncbi:flavin reductase [Streptomyces sulfonofaciens]|uniref:Flavin reductase n=1 Tax=Streptomyces sulfonofaciens TaxID=68272 RepID=A0A919KTA2_9ACTN|nr:flavin reductase family protein [Streptomyces sulfonofaciens]GHH71607.1 flavin reductase [Streptomyces sulfonofaciens]